MNTSNNKLLINLEHWYHNENNKRYNEQHNTIQIQWQFNIDIKYCMHILKTLQMKPWLFLLPSTTNSYGMWYVIFQSPSELDDCDPSIAIRWYGTNVEIWHEFDVQRPVCMHLEICELHLWLVSHSKYVNILYNKQNDKPSRLIYYTTNTW